MVGFLNKQTFDSLFTPLTFVLDTKLYKYIRSIMNMERDDDNSTTSEMSEDPLPATLYVEEEEKKGGRPQSEIRTLFYEAVYVDPTGGTSLDNVLHYVCRGCKRQFKKKLDVLEAHAMGCGDLSAQAKGM